MIQRVQTASVVEKGGLIGKCGAGLLILIYAMMEDTPKHAAKLVSKIAKSRIFLDTEGRIKKSLLNIDGSALVISHFSLVGDTKRGNRFSFLARRHPNRERNITKFFKSRCCSVYTR